MARHRTGGTGEARMLLDDSARAIRAYLESAPGRRVDGIDPWADWMNAHILLKEAEGAIGAAGAN
jgi:hypothetical protein